MYLHITAAIARLVLPNSRFPYCILILWCQIDEKFTLNIFVTYKVQQNLHEVSHWLSMWIFIYIYIYMYIHTYIYAYAHAYAHAHTHTNILTAYFVRAQKISYDLNWCDNNIAACFRLLSKSVGATSAMRPGGYYQHHLAKVHLDCEMGAK